MNVAVHSIELCAGVGMLGEGARAAFQHLGITHRTVCYVEREASAAAQLVTLMEAGILDSAPVWSDILSFRGEQFRGKVDCVIAGFPCQDLSVAGKRAGLDGKRSGLFFRVCDIADDCAARFLILENVSGIASATASVVDEEEGELEERAAARVVGELADRGWDSEWITLSASDVGASHERARWFCFAWRVADAGGERRQQITRSASGNEGSNEGRATALNNQPERVGEIEKLGNSGLQHKLIQQRKDGAESAGAGGAVANTKRARRTKTGSGSEINTRRKSEPGCRAVANTSESRLQGREQRRTCTTNRGGQEAHGSTSELCRTLPIFAPGPEGPRWPEIIRERPDLAPATEPGVRMLADGMAMLVDESRSHQLRAIGNGVVPLCAATAIVMLARRSGVLTRWKFN